ncbi:Gtr1/RagA G protein conserved region-domain-containing protein [Catenaria anguillulae PL171]|uniref:GTP-binding protein n=1 Tax=Catenaria anguillulae PL171 TaxID=765915 RepID=A0A1Y2HXH4_9FUNG|nr:Gtr1/RagA G protein conserved region-domain-containing protein [Catenaria anguillulae PL171]
MELRLQLPRILLMGLRRSGKTSIQKVVFHKMAPNETIFLESTTKMGVERVHSFIQFTIADFPGQIDFTDPSTFDLESIFGAETATDVSSAASGAIIFVIDAQDDYYDALQRLYVTVATAHRYNPNLYFEVFIHKVDGLSDDTKIETQRDIHQRVTDELLDMDLLEKIQLSFYLTSIYDHSIYEAFSKVVQKLIPQLPTLENLLNTLCSSSSIEKAFLFDSFTKIYLATDSSPVDVQSYELCSDMIDVMMDLEAIYNQPGIQPPAPTDSAAAAHALPPIPQRASTPPNRHALNGSDPHSPHVHAHPSTPPSLHASTASPARTPASTSGALAPLSGPTPAAPRTLAAAALAALAADRKQGTTIRLSTGIVLTMVQMDKLSLVCLLRAENYDGKAGLLDFNFSKFKEAIWAVFMVGYGGGAAQIVGGVPGGH